MNLLAPKRSRLTLYVFVCGLSMAVGWVLRDAFGTEAGAMFPGALTAAAAALVSSDDRKRARLASLCIAGAIGTAVCGGIPYESVAMRLVHGDDVFRATVAMAGRGVLWGGFAGAILGMALSRARYHLRDLAWLVPVGVLWVSTLHIPHGDDLSTGDMTWILAATLTGLVAWLWTCKQDRSAVFVGFCGAAGFGIGAPLAFHFYTHVVPGCPSVDWWRVAQLLWGFVGGAGIGVAVFALDEAGEGPMERSHEGAAIVGATLVAWWLPVRNGLTWVNAAFAGSDRCDAVLAGYAAASVTVLAVLLAAMARWCPPSFGRRASALMCVWLLWTGFVVEYLATSVYTDGVPIVRTTHVWLACAFLGLVVLVIVLARKRTPAAPDCLAESA